MKKIKIFGLEKGAVIHFIGIGGISMSGLAEILLKNGYRVTGSDLRDTDLIQRLRGEGAVVHIGQNARNISDPELCVYTAAVKEDNDEYAAALSSGKRLVDRASLLGEIMRSYHYSTAVSGTHGKTTTTSMLSHIFLSAQKDPTISIGGELAAIGGNIRTGEGEYFITEACEYHQSFLKFFPYASVILNIEEDHLDYFRDLGHIIETFREFANISGLVVANGDDANVVAATTGHPNVRYYSLSQDSDWYACNIEFDGNGCGHFDAYEKGSFTGRFTLSVPGRHNVSNALAAVALSRLLGLNTEDIRHGLADFKVVRRRFERLGKYRGALVVDDYAHHPTEIAATLTAARRMTAGRIFCVFQPHTYTRTAALMDGFVKALGDGSNVIVTDIFAARERDTGAVHASQLADKLPGAVYIKDFSGITDYLSRHIRPGDMIITMGAGNIHEVGEALIRLNVTE